MRALIFSLVFAGCASTSSRPEPASYPPPQSSLQRGMRNCPSALAGATTRVINTEDGVDLEVTSADPVVQRQIIELAIVHEHLGHPNSAEAAHTGMHGGPGYIGYCPVIHVGTTVTYQRRSDGAVIHIHARKPEAVSQMQQAITERVNMLATRKTLTARRPSDS